MIVTLTLNPSLDRTIEVGRADPRRGHPRRRRPPRPRRQGRQRLPGAAGQRGRRRVAVLPVGGDEGGQLVRLLQAEGVDVVAVPIAGRTRSNVTLAEPDGTVTKINEPGTALSARRARRDRRRACSAPRPARRLGGRLRQPPARGRPTTSTPGCAAGFAGAGIQRRRRHQRPGPARPRWPRARPGQAQPGGARRGRRRASLSLGDVVEAAQSLRAAGRRHRAGQPRRRRRRPGRGRRRRSRRGARWPSRAAPSAPATPCWPGSSPPGPRGERRARRGLAWGAAAVRLPGSRMPGPDDIRRDHVRVRPRPIRTCPTAVRPADRA